MKAQVQRRHSPNETIRSLSSRKLSARASCRDVPLRSHHARQLAPVSLNVPTSQLPAAIRPVVEARHPGLEQLTIEQLRELSVQLRIVDGLSSEKRLQSNVAAKELIAFLNARESQEAHSSRTSKRPLFGEAEPALDPERERRPGEAPSFEASKYLIASAARVGQGRLTSRALPALANERLATIRTALLTSVAPLLDRPTAASKLVEAYAAQKPPAHVALVGGMPVGRVADLIDALGSVRPDWQKTIHIDVGTITDDDRLQELLTRGGPPAGPNSVLALVSTRALHPVSFLNVDVMLPQVQQLVSAAIRSQIADASGPTIALHASNAVNVPKELQSLFSGVARIDV